MNNLLENTFLVSFLCSILIIFFNFLDSKITKKKKTKKEYFKIFVISFISISITLYTINIIKKYNLTNVKEIKTTAEPIHLDTGIPDF